MKKLLIAALVAFAVPAFAEDAAKTDTKEKAPAGDKAGDKKAPAKKKGDKAAKGDKAEKAKGEKAEKPAEAH
jgi:hypothetical protein